MNYFNACQNGLLLSTKVSPKASLNKIVKWEHDALKILVTAPPDKNLANNSVIELLSAAFKIPKSQIQLFRGQKQRKKIFLFIGQEKEDLEIKLEKILKK